MKRYTYQAIVYIEVDADDEDTALDLAENELNIEPSRITLYEVEDLEEDADLINESRRYR